VSYLNRYKPAPNRLKPGVPTPQEDDVTEAVHFMTGLLSDIAAKLRDIEARVIALETFVTTSPTNADHATNVDHNAHIHHSQEVS
jgi:hypothetical protein